MTRRHGERRPLLHATTALVLFLALAMTLAAAGAARSVRDANERRLLRQRADGVGSIIQGLGGSFEADLRAAAAYASRDTIEEFAAHLATMRDENTATGTWALVDRVDGAYHVAFVDPSGGRTYFGGAPEAPFEEQLRVAFGGGFAVTGIYGEGPARRLGIAAGVPGSDGRRIAYLEFPLLAVAASSPDASYGASLFENIDVGLYVGSTPTKDGLVFGTFDGAPPARAMRVDFELGGQTIVVAVAPTAPLSGRLAHSLPYIVLGMGLAVAALAALLIEVASRKQRRALALAAEIRAQHAALERATADQAKAEAGLRESQKREALGLLAGGIAHDFNNLLAVITGYCDLMSTKVDDVETLADIGEIEGAARRGAALTRQLLLFARDEPGEQGTADANLVIGTLAPLLGMSAGEDVALIMDLSASPATVPITASELEQIVVNLVVNARHAIPAAGCIAVRTRSGDDGRNVVLEVADDGVGMTPEVAARAFEPLFTTRPPGQGTGLGLATVRSIAQRVGGLATIDSEVGKGTTVRVMLPSTVDAPSTPAPLTVEHDGEGPRATVLLVEDEEPVRRAMARMLERAGYRVHQATSGLDAIARFLDTCVPDVLVTDVIMPGGLSGQDVVDRFRTRHPDLAVVFVSGYTPDLLSRRGLEDTSVRMLAKPFTERELRAAAEGALASRTPVD